MPDSDNNAMIRQWLKDKGYSDRDVNKVLAKLAEHDHQTLSDAVYDSIGGDGKSLEDMIGDLLKEE
jgi:hypothetical protein